MTDTEKQLARDVLTMAVHGGMPDTYFQTDSRIARACEVLGIDQATARIVGEHLVATESVRQWLNIAEAAEYLNTPERFIRRMIETKRVPFHHFGKYVRFNRADLDAFARSGRIEAR